MTTPTWVVNVASIDPGEYLWMTVGLTTKEYIAISGDEASPGNTCTFVWIILDKNNHLVQVGLRPHDHVTEAQCLDQVPRLLAMVRPWSADTDPRTLLGRTLP